MSDANQVNVRTGRRHRVRWLSVLAGLGIVFVSGVVVADVVLVYTTATGVGANTTGPFQFQDGANYATANSLGFVTSTYPGGASPGPTVTTTIQGVQDVPVAMFDVNEFATAALTPNSAAVGNLVVPSPTALTPAGVVCAYAFISDAAPSLGTTAVTGAPAGCTATVPTLGTLSGGCAGQTAGVATVDLLTGAIVGTNIGGDCTVPSGTASGTIVLYVSYWIQTNAAVTATTLNSFQVPVSMP
jgi:hypothetical protein